MRPMNREIISQHARQRARLRKALGNAVRYNQLAMNACNTDGQWAPVLPKTHIWKRDRINAAHGANMVPKTS